MDFTNDDEQYGFLARFFHWSIAFLILGLIPVGLYMTQMENSPFKLEVYAMHKSFGLLVLFLGVARIIWRFVSPPPEHLETHAGWERAMAGAAHAWLYVCVIGMPLSGWLMSSAGQFPIPFFGVHLPALMGANENLAHTFYQVHEILAYTLIVVLGLHIAGALKHHVIDCDETLERMAFRSRIRILPAALVVLVTGAVFAATGLMIFKDFTKARPEVSEQAAVKADAVNSADLPDTSSLPANGWAIVPSASSLEFSATLYNSPFTGKFGKFGGQIVFNPSDLSDALADIRIDMNNFSTGDESRDGNMRGADWFDTENFPESRFVATKFEESGEGKYVAIGNLMIRDVTMPLIIPFNLEIVDDKAHMTAEVEIDRLAFGMGKGEWEDEATVGHKVIVKINIQAIH